MTFAKLFLSLCAVLVLSAAPATSFDFSHLPLNNGFRHRPNRINTALSVSELHIPGYRQTKIPFLLKDDEGDETTQSHLHIRKYISTEDYTSMIPFETGYLLHATKKPILTPVECQSIIDEAEYIASKIGWTTKRVSSSMYLWIKWSSTHHWISHKMQTAWKLSHYRYTHCRTSQYSRLS